MAYDDTKITGSQLTADEYNAFVTEMKTRADNATGSGAPSSTPSMVSMIYVDTLNDDIYMSVGTASSADWVQVNGAGSVDKILNADSKVEVLDEAGYGRVNFNVDGVDQLNVIDGSVRPEADDTLSLGISSRRFSDLFTYDIALGGVIKVDGQTVAGTDGDLVYLSAADTWSQADASVEGTCSEQLGIRLSATEVAVYGVFTTTGLTAGAIYYASETAGAFTTTAPATSLSIIRIIGYALSTTELFLCVDPTYLEVA